jgi:ligand-binding sensor domain-containing protein
MLEHFTEKDGLSGSRIYDIAQNRDGYIYLATDNGITQMDGHSTKRFGAEDGLVSLEVFGLAYDRQGILWANTNNGLFLKLKDRFHPLADFSEAITTSILSIHPYKDGIHVQEAGDDSYLMRWNGETVDATFFASGTTIQQLAIKDDSTTYFHQSKSITLPHLRAEDMLLKSQVLYVAVGHDSTVWLLKDGRMYNRSPTKLVQIPRAQLYDGFGEDISLFGIDKQDRLWICDARKLMSFIPSPTVGGCIPKVYAEGISAIAMLQDREGNIWIGTKKQGLYFISSKALQIDTYEHRKGTDLLAFHALYNDGQMTLVSTSDGVVKEFGPARFNRDVFKLPYRQDGSNEIKKLERIGDYLLAGGNSGTWGTDLRTPGSIYSYEYNRLAKDFMVLDNQQILTVNEGGLSKTLFQKTKVDFMERYITHPRRGTKLAMHHGFRF